MTILRLFQIQMIDDRASLTCGEFLMKCQAFYPLSFIFEINYIVIGITHFLNEVVFRCLCVKILLHLELWFGRR